MTWKEVSFSAFSTNPLHDKRAYKGGISSNFTMDPHRPSPIPLYPYPPPTAQDQLLSDESSDFPHIRVHESTPDLPNTQSLISHSSSRYHSSDSESTIHSEHRSSPTRSQSPGPQLPRRFQRTSRRVPNKPGPVLGHRNIVNTVEVTVKHGNVSHLTFLQFCEWFYRISTNYWIFSRLGMLSTLSPRPLASVAWKLWAALTTWIITIIRRGSALAAVISKMIWSG